MMARPKGSLNVNPAKEQRVTFRISAAERETMIDEAAAANGISRSTQILNMIRDSHKRAQRAKKRS